MVNFDMMAKIVFEWVLPFSVMIGLFFTFVRTTYRTYERFDIDRMWKFITKVGITLGVLFIVLVYLKNAEWFLSVVDLTKQALSWVGEVSFIKKINFIATDWWKTGMDFVLKWMPIYIRAFVLVWFFSSIVFIQSLIWRVSFPRALNIVVSSVILSPYLVSKYINGHETPFFDHIYSKLYVAKVKENLNDSYFDALQGINDKGEKFESGAGGTVQTRRIKATTVATRQTRVSIKTAGGTRQAEIIIRNSRETDTDKLIEQSTKGLGLRLVAPSIRLQEDPIFNNDRGGYVFDSAVPYNAGNALGKWKDNFRNPFTSENRVSHGGKGFFYIMKSNYKGVFDYVRHLTPPAIYNKVVDGARKDFFYDTTLQKAKYIARQNMDLTIIPEPLDVTTGNNISEQTIIAKQIAKARQEDVSNALNAFKLNGTFEDVSVGGNTAIYKYTLPKAANLPSDFKKIQEGLAHMMKTPDLPIVLPVAGTLTVSMVNGVNIPVDFRKMIQNRKRGMSTLLTGIAGVDALGNNIYVEFTEQTPHIMLFGKTGSGKTVTIMSVVFSIMDSVTPEDVKFIPIDGKGNSFEFLRTDEEVAEGNYHPNPFIYSQPADGSGDIEYVRAIFHHIEREVVRRIQLFKSAGVSKISEWNNKFKDQKLYYILVVADEVSALTDTDDQLKAGELSSKGITDKIEYIAKMSRSVGIHMLLANQTARKEKIKGKISANIGGRISLGVTEPIESDIALPDSKIPVHYITQAGEFYSTLNGIRNAEHGNTPYLSDQTMYDINESLEKEFGHHDYVFTREQIIKEMKKDLGEEQEGELEEEDATSYSMPSTFPTIDTPIDELEQVVYDFPVWADMNKGSRMFVEHSSFMGDDVSPLQRKKNKAKIAEMLIRASEVTLKNQPDTRPSSGSKIAKITEGEDQKAI